MTPHELDAVDPLARFRERFILPEGVIYLDGNSLGPLPRATVDAVARTVTNEWGEGLIGSWTGAGWVEAPGRIGDKIARLIGAEPGEVVACDSTSVNAFKALAAALSLNPGRATILSERGNFPTDVYMIEGLAALSGGAIQMRLVDPEALEAAIDEDTAAVLVTQVNYKTGRIRDMAETTRIAHAKGAVTIWDLSHSAGSIPVALNEARADLAIGCGYKFLNGGPGAPAWIYVAQRHQGAAHPALTGWFGHARPFDFADEYEPAEGIARFQCGTPAVLGLAALECGVDGLLEADMADLRAKAVALGELFVRAMAPLCEPHGFVLASPADSALRASQISYAHPDAYAIVQALIARGVIGDFRAPDILRFGLTPLTLRHADVARSVEILGEVMERGEWDRAEYRTRKAVT
ncbi:MAG TPA: kynureninase [Novosphingobium sp.]|nr:kynureninase [Novosphingobium sp.]